MSGFVPDFEERIQSDPHGQWQLAASVIAASNASVDRLREKLNLDDKGPE